MTSRYGRGRSSVRRGLSLTASTAIALGAVAVLGAGVTASGADPARAGDCTPTFPLGEVAEGDAVTGLTVARGTTPAPFEGHVIGVLDDGIAPGTDLVIVDLDSPDIDRAGGIWSGMSGSPVYAADGRLVGAVSYGLSYGNSKIAGVTPADAMHRIGGLTSTPLTVDLPAKTARAVASASGVTAAQAGRGLQRLPMPLSATGVDTARAGRAGATNLVRGLTSGTASASRAEVGPETVVAGGNLGASVAYGDVMMAGVGTVTTVCDGVVLGFGHPLAHLGHSSLSLHAASAVYVQPDSGDTPYKIARYGAPIGTIDEDRLAGVKGFLGDTPDGVPIRVRGRLGRSAYDGTTTVTVSGGDLMATAAYSQVAVSLDNVVDARRGGQVLLRWRLEGTRGDRRFTLEDTNRFLTGEDIAYEAGFELADILWSLSSAADVKITSVDVEANADLDRRSARVARLERRQNGRWLPLAHKSAVEAKAGRKVVLRAVVRRGSEVSYVPVTFKAPRAVKGRVVRVHVMGGGSVESYPDSTSFRGLKKFLEGRVRGDSVLTYVMRRGETRESVTPRVSAPQDAVVRGRKVVRVRVR